MTDLALARRSTTEHYEEQLARAYGQLLGLEALRHVLGYPSTVAMRRAHQRGVFPVPLRRLPGRRGLFALTKDVATWLEHLSDTPDGGNMNTDPP